MSTISNIDYVSSWKSKELSAESIKAPTTSDDSLTPELNYYDTKPRVTFNGICLKLSKNSYTYRTMVNIYIFYELGASGSHDNDATLKNCLFGAVTLTKNADIDKYKYFGYGMGFDRRSSFSFPSGGFGQNISIFGVDMSSSAHIYNKKKNMLVLGKGPKQRLEHTLAAEKMYSINFTVTKKKKKKIKVFDLMSRTNETKKITWHEKFKCECRLDAIVGNNKQHWNKIKSSCECKELIDKGVCDKGFIWNPSNCKCKCDKSCNISEYLDYKTFNCKKS